METIPYTMKKVKGTLKQKPSESGLLLS